MQYEIEEAEPRDFIPTLEALSIMIKCGVVTPTVALHRAYEMGAEAAFATVAEELEREAIDDYLANDNQ